MAVRAGVDALGFIFVRSSRRWTPPERARDIIVGLPAEVTPVGVFLNTPRQKILEVIETTGIRLIQLHGDETPKVLNALDGQAYKAFRGIPESIDGFERKQAPAFLVDASVKGLYGGSGVTADWSGAARLAKQYPLLLAGGLTPENVAEAVRQVQPWGVDVASGVESVPRVKDVDKMWAFIEAARNASSLL